MKALYTIIILLIPFFGFGQIPDNISNDGLVGWWSFNGNANDESTNSNDGIVYGATLSTDRFGNENSAYEFNVESAGGWGSAQNRIVVENPSIPDVNAFTMSAWVLLNEKPSPFNNRSHTIMGRWDGNGTSVFRNQISYSGEYYSQIVIDDIDLTHSSPNPINYNEWNHVVMTFDGVNLKKYINGELDSEISSSGQISYSETDLTFGETHMANGHWYLFSGKLDDLSYWSRALTETEITELYNSTNGLLTYVPDDNFEQALIDFGYDDILDNYVLTENISGLTYIDLCTKDIADLTGIEDFVSLTNLCCAENQLTALDLSNNTQLETLNANANQLTSVDISNSPALYELNIRINQLTEIDLSNNIELINLDINANLLTNLDLSNNTNLSTLNCGVNSILALDLSNNVDLTSVNCGFNNITSLDFSNNPDLTYINCRANELTFLNVTNNTLLNELNFSSNQLLNIDLTNNLLLEVVTGIYNNDLQTIDVSNNDSLKVLLLYACDLISIDLSNNLSLTDLNLNGNQLSYLDLSNNSNLINLNVSVNYNLTFLDLRNGNNINMSLNATASNLTCINVDDTEWATENWTNDNGSIDTQVSFSEDCQNLTYVPDDNFEQALIDFGYDNVLDDYVLTENISDITYLNVSTKGISDLTGIEDFESLEILYCFENNLSSLDISFNSNLITLYCYNNQITNIDISQNQNLESFDIGNNNLSSIDVSNNTSLTLLHCYNNQLSSIDVSQNTLLINLYCWGNQISNLDISQNLELTKLQCYDNLLSILDISLNTELEDLYCSSNQLSSLDISNNIDLKVLRCGINQLSSLDVSNNLDLEIIYCSNNSITELDVSTNSFLSEFYCRVNELTKLDVSNNTNLTILNCSNNDLDSLNLKNGNNTQLVLTATSNPDLFCITVDDTDWSSANWTIDNQSINNWNSFSEDCELGFVTFGCTDSSSCNFQPTANTDDGSCIYIESNDTIISCDNYFWNDSMYYQSGDYSDTLTSVEGCDSITNLNLIILQSDSIFNDTTVCDEFIWAEDTIISSGNYFFAYTNSNGCDSIHYFDVTINPSSEAIDEKFTCEDSFLWLDNNTYFEDNITAQYIIANEYNCPLTITLNLTFLENPTSLTTVEECDSYTWNGSTYNTSGQYTYTTTADNGCDSTATLDLTINDSQFSTDVQFDCNEFTWIDGITYTESNNSATVTLTANDGCDSIVTLNLTIYESDNTFSSITVCDEFIWNNISYTQSGLYTNTFVNSNGCDSTHTYDLTILESTFGIDTQVHCDEYTWIDGNTYTQSTNSPTFTLTNSLGCDSIVILDLSILESTSSFTSASACESYLWNDSLYTESGLKVFNTTNSVGCDSIARLFLTIYEPTFATDTQVHCDEFTWIDGISYTESNNSATHTIIGGNSNGCDSIVTLNLTIFNSVNTFGDTTVCDEFVWNGINYTESGIFSNTFVNSNGCDSTHTYDLTIFESTFGIDTQVHCDEYTWIDGNSYTQSTNSPTFTLTNSLGCDSIVILNLSILESTSSFTSASACESYLWNDSLYTESGLKVFNTTNSVGCDSIARLFLTIYEPTFGTDTQVHCDEFTWIDGISYTENNNSATHTIIGGNSNGCDSIVTLNLTIYQSDTSLTEITICDSYEWNGNVYTENGIYTNSSQQGDNIFSLDFDGTNDYITFGDILNNPTFPISFQYNVKLSTDLALGESITAFHTDNDIINGSIYYGIWSHISNTGISINYGDGTGQGQADRRSYNAENLNLNHGQWYNIVTIIRGPQDMSIYLDGIEYIGAYSGSGGTIANSENTFQIASINTSGYSPSFAKCSIDNFSYWDLDLSLSDIQKYMSCSPSGEEEGLQLYLDFEEGEGNTVYDLSGNGNDGIIYGANYSSDIIEQSCQLTSSLTGCDSVAVLNLTILESTFGIDSQVHCDNYTWINGITYTESTSSPTYALTNSVGCDSVVTLNLSILESDSTFTNETHCDQLVWDDSTYTISGIYTNYYTNVEGCDSSHTINLSIYYSDSSFAQITACDEFVWEGSVYTESGIYTNSYINSNGCDSTNTLDLTILNSSSGTDTQVHCDNYTWINGITYTESTSSPTYALTNSVGCDSVVTLNLSILESDSTFTNETHCDQLVWDDSTYTISGIYTNYYTNVEGCDSSHTINLSIYYSDSSFAQITACDEFVWEGSVYTESGIYTNSYINSNGCDSTNTLDLTILNSSSGTDTQVHCDNYTWINGITYTESTSSPTYALTNSVGCDSVVTLNLSILESDSTFTNETHCDQLVWDDSTYTISGIYTNYYTNVEGCDSSHTINLSIYYSDSSFAQITACDEFVWEGSVYTESGIYTNSYINSNGCDSTNTLDLTILNSSSGTDTQVHCDNYTWIDGITYTQSTSSPTYVLTNSVGCDSVVSLNLSILESDSTFINETHCDEFIWNDSTYTSTGTYTNNYINTIGCDSIVTLNLTINNSANTFENISICDVFIWDDSTYTESGSYINNYTTTYGCDSTHTINLTILNSNSGTDVEEHCDEFTWIDGITYTESTSSPTYTLTNSVGCDSLVTLNLTIYNSYNLDTNITSCDAFVWDDSTYIESGVYTNIYSSINGCDSVYTINLSLLETTYGIDSIVSCDEYTWIDGISYTENTNSPTFTLTNSVGCDSVVNLNLTILESTETNTSIVACGSFEWYGTTYYQSGTYYNYSINSVGCDIIEVLELTIENCGCIDPIADNFNPNATLDDGSCVYCESFSIIITASSDVSEVGGNDGYVFASGIGGSAQYSLNVFDENFIPQNPFGLTAGIYTVAVFDAVTGCVAETLFTIYEPTVYFNCTNLGCVESSVVDDSYSTLEECEANCSSVTVSPCDSVPNGLFVDNIIDNRIRFNWSPTEVAPSHYMIRYRELGTNSWTVITAGPVNTQAYYGTSRTRYFMEPATTYEWSIRARVLNDDLSIDCQSAWSATSEYTTLAACANLENLSVFTEANWVTFFADAPSQEWGVWQSKGKIREFGSTNYRYVNGDDNGNINSLKGNFTESTNYEWHTKAWCTANVDEDGNSDPMYHSGWGEFSNFTTEDPCDKMPINLSTSSNGANTAVIMSWDTPPSGNPDHYFLEMTNITSGDVYEWNNIPGTDNSKTKFNQSSGDEISWKIRGACGTNGTSFATPFSSTVYYVLGGEKLSNLQNLMVYPNPSRKEFNISFDISERQIVDMKVVNSIGQEVYENSLEIKGTFDTKIDLSGYSKGVYNLSIETTDGIKNHKLILQ